MTAMKPEKETRTSAAFFAEMIAAIDHEDVSVEKPKAETLTGKLNRMFPGATAKVSIDDFHITGADELTDAEKDFLAENKIPILCTLQQSLLVRHLFSNKPELREIFIGKIQERGDPAEAAVEITTKWFARLIENDVGDVIDVKIHTFSSGNKLPVDEVI